MTDTVVEQPGYPVNELGEVVVQTGVGTSNVVGMLQGSLKPVDSVSGKMVVRLPEQIPDSRAFQSGQPFGITRPVTSQGRMFSDFSGTRCTAVSAAGTTFTNDYTGYDGSNVALPVQSMTGLPSMLKLTIASDSTQQVQITNANLGNITTSGLVGLWMYADLSAKVGAGAVSMGMDMFTTTGFSAGYTRVSWNSNQVRHGWNFLTYKQLHAIADMPASEVHFVGLTATKNGTGANGDLLTNPLKYINIDVANMNGCVLYFDSLWTDFSSLAQFVIGCDQATTDTVDYALPKFKQYNWKGYFASPYRVWVSGTKLVSDWRASPQAPSATLYANGWDCINHTVNHLANGALTAPGEIRYEVEASTPWYLARGFSRGQEFYASPQSSTSILAERVIAEAGIKLQRHSKRSNVHVTQFGVDNERHLGSVDISNATVGFQKASLIKAWIDNIIAYGATGFPFWHNITTLGDTGSGEDVTGNDLNMTLSAFNSVMDYIAAKEAAGLCRVRDGMTGFYYGLGR